LNWVFFVVASGKKKNQTQILLFHGVYFIKNQIKIVMLISLNKNKIKVVDGEEEG
jgi:hypothetical protein